MNRNSKKKTQKDLLIFFLAFLLFKFIYSFPFCDDHFPPKRSINWEEEVEGYYYVNAETGTNEKFGTPKNPKSGLQNLIPGSYIEIHGNYQAITQGKDGNVGYIQNGVWIVEPLDFQNLQLEETGVYIHGLILDDENGDKTEGNAGIITKSDYYYGCIKNNAISGNEIMGGVTVVERNLVLHDSSISDNSGVWVYINDAKWRTKI